MSAVYIMHEMWAETISKAFLSPQTKRVLALTKRYQDAAKDGTLDTIYTLTQVLINDCHGQVCTWVDSIQNGKKVLYVGARPKNCHHADHVVKKMTDQFGTQVKTCQFYNSAGKPVTLGEVESAFKDRCSCDYKNESFRKTNDRYFDGDDFQEMHVYTSCSSNLPSAFLRSALPNLKPDPKIMEEFLPYARSRLDELLEEFPMLHEEYTVEDYIQDALPCKRQGIIDGMEFARERGNVSL